MKRKNYVTIDNFENKIILEDENGNQYEIIDTSFKNKVRAVLIHSVDGLEPKDVILNMIESKDNKPLKLFFRAEIVNYSENSNVDKI
jgi:hypothetical protein